MPVFFYKARLSPQKIIEGEIEAETQTQAINRLINQGYFPISIEETSKLYRQKSLFFKKVSSRDIYIFTHQLSSLITSGLPLLNALNTILGQTHNIYFKSILSDITDKIKDGRAFSEALSNWPNIFSQFFISMIKSAEVGGNLDEILNRLADYSSKEQELKSNIKGALAYPFFIAVVGCLTIFVLLGFVIPRLLVMFEDMGESLPLPTRMLIGTSNFLKNYGWFIITVIFIIVFISLRRLKNPESRLTLDRFKLKLPLIGEIVQKIEISRFAHTLSTLLSSGIPIVGALKTTQAVIGNAIIKGEVKRFQDEIRKGASFSTAVRSSPYFPIFMINIVSIGEEAGTLERALLRVSEEYSREVEQRIKALTRLLEPAMILIMGLVVGFIVISMLLPIFQINLIVR